MNHTVRTLWRSIIRNDLRSRVMMTLLVFSMVPLLVAAYQGYHCGRLAVFDLTKMHVTSVVEARHRMIEEWLTERENDILSLVALPGLQRLSGHLDQEETEQKTIRALLSSVAHENGPYENMTLYGLDWMKIAEVNHSGHDSEELLSEPFKEAVGEAARIHFGVAHQHEAGDIGIHFGCPVRTDDGEIAGYLIANLNLSKSMAPILHDRSGLGISGQVYLISRDLEIIIRPSGDGPDGPLHQQANPVLASTIEQSGQDVRVYRGYDGEDVLGTAKLIPLNDWAAVVEIDIAEATHWIQVLLLRIGIMVVASLICILIAGLYLSRAIARPFAEVAGAAHKIAEGDVDTHVGESRIWEAEEVRRAFERMVTELRHNEKLLVRSGRLAAIGELTSSIVHEMRNPLSSIKMNLQALGKSEESDWRTAELVEIAGEQTHRLELMLTELLQYGKPTKLNMDETKFSGIVEWSLEACQESIIAKSVQVETVDQLESRPIWTDRELACRVFTNLVRNATDAVEIGGSILIVGKPSEEGDSEITIEVHDDGPGLSSEQMARAFSPFYTTKPDGIGLGLAVVKNCIDALGGTIEVERSDKGGALFTVRLPIGVPVATGEVGVRE